MAKQLKPLDFFQRFCLDHSLLHIGLSSLAVAQLDSLQIHYDHGPEVVAGTGPEVAVWKWP